MRGRPAAGGGPLTPADRTPPEDVTATAAAGIPSDPPIPIDASRPLPPRRLLRGSRRMTHLVGRRLLVGVTVRDSAGAVVHRDQFCGTVLEVSDGVVVVDRSGSPIVLPADDAAYEPAPPGTYRLSGSGEEVVDPDYVTTWTLLERPAGSPPPTISVPPTGGPPVVRLDEPASSSPAPPPPTRPAAAHRSRFG